VAQNLPGYEAYVSLQDPRRLSQHQRSHQPAGPCLPP
jgi:hypothetical protein